MSETTEFKMPTEMVELPSRGLLYPKDNPLSAGRIEMKYMSAVEEDILTNTNYIDQGIVIDKLLQSLIVTKINYDDLLAGDKDAILVAARLLGYGKDYTFTYSENKPKGYIDLSTLQPKNVDYSVFTQGVNEFTFTLPVTQNVIKFKLLTHRDEKAIEDELKGLKRLNPNSSTRVTTRLKHTIVSVNDKRDTKSIREFIDKGYLLAPDSLALRKYIKQISPGIDFTYYPEDAEEGIELPITVDFFWIRS
jgi:hypothetical protein